MEEIGHNDRAGARGAWVYDAGLAGGDAGRQSGHARLRLGGWLLVALALLLAGSSSAWAASAPTPVNTSVPLLTGTPALGQTLSCSLGSWSGNPSSFSYAWLRDGFPIAGQTGSAYSVQSVDQGHLISCSVTAANAGGEYTIAGLPGGSYEVFFGHPVGIISEGDYLPQYFNGQSAAATASLVSVTAPSTVSGIDAELQPGGQITGKVISAAAHAPVANIEVCAWGEEAGFPSGFPYCATTDAAGDYTIVALPGGTYSVRAPVYFVRCASSSCPEQNYLSQGVENVSVTAPNTTSSIDLELQPGGSITGKVTDANTHLPLANVLVCAYEGEITESQSGCATTDAAGAYTIRALTSMKYTLTFTAQNCVEGQGCARQNYQPLTIKPVPVTAPNATTIDTELQSGGEIAGRITSAATHAPVAHAQVCAVEEGGKVERSCAYTDTSGEYTAAGLRSGSYEVSFNANEYEATHTGAVTVTAPNTTAAINAELQPKPTGKITGTVTDASTHAPIANIHVCAGEAAAKYFSYGCTTTGPAGEYTFAGLPSGSYEIAFSPSVESCFIMATSGCTEPDYLSQTLGAVSVTAPNTTTGVNAQLQPGGEITGRITSAATHTGLAGVVACASTTTGEPFRACGTTNSPGGSASASSPAVTVTGSTSGSKSTGGTTARSARTIQAALNAALRSSRPPTIASLLKGGSYRLSFIAPEAGTLTVEWVINNAMASSRRRSRRHHRSKPVVIATGSQRFSSAGSGRVRLRLTAAGRKLLKGRKTILVTETLTFTPATGSPQTGQRAIRLRSGRTRPPKKGRPVMGQGVGRRPGPEG